MVSPKGLEGMSITNTGALWWDYSFYVCVSPEPSHPPPRSFELERTVFVYALTVVEKGE